MFLDRIIIIPDYQQIINKPGLNKNTSPFGFLYDYLYLYFIASS